MKNKKKLNKKISTEVGVGVVLLVAILIGGAFYLQNRKGQSVFTSPVVKQSQSNNQQVSIPQENIQTNVYTDATYGFEIVYPSDWSITKPSSAVQDKQNLVFVFSTNGKMSDGTNGTLSFGKYDIYNDSLTDSVDGNVEILNSKVKAELKEVEITGGRAFYNPLQTALPSNQRDIFIVGKNVIFNGNVSIFPYNADTKLDSQKLTEFANILSNFKFL